MSPNKFTKLQETARRVRSYQTSYWLQWRKPKWLLTPTSSRFPAVTPWLQRCLLFLRRALRSVWCHPAWYPYYRGAYQGTIPQNPRWAERRGNTRGREDEEAKSDRTFRVPLGCFSRLGEKERWNLALLHRLPPPQWGHQKRQLPICKIVWKA